METPELQQLAEVKPELLQTAQEKREEVIEELKDQENSRSKKRLLEKFKDENFEEVKDGFFVDEEDAKEAMDKIKEAGGAKTLINDVTGEEKQIDPTLVESGENFETTETPYAAEVPKNAADAVVIGENAEAAGAVISAEDDKKISEDETPEVEEEVRYYNWNANDVVAIQEDNKVIYKDIWNATDLLVTTSEEGIKEDLILKNSTAPTHFDYVVETLGLVMQTTSDGGLIFINEKGEEKFFVPAPDVTDVNGVKTTKGLKYVIGWEEIEQLQTTNDEFA